MQEGGRVAEIVDSLHGVIEAKQAGADVAIVSLISTAGEIALSLIVSKPELKEAYLKAIGTGLSFSSTAFSISYGRDEQPQLLRTERSGDHARRWRMIDVPCPIGYAAAACWNGETLELRRFYAPHSQPDRLQSE